MGASGAGGGGGGSGAFVSMSGGICPPITINIINGYKTTTTIRKNFGGFGTEDKLDGRPATASHTSNVPKIPSCGSSCAILYKLK